MDKSKHGPCLPSLWRCDGRDNCPDGSDETDCPDNCSNSEFFCISQRRCIPEAWRCDDEIDCLNGEDERPCNCPSDYFKCQSGGCVQKQYVCDGVYQCPDLSDEWGCFTIDKEIMNDINETESNNLSDVKLNIANNLLQIKRSNGEYALVCSDNWNLTKSDEICRKLGYANALSWSTYNVYSNKSNVISLDNLEIIDNCKEGVVSLKCKDYGKN